MQNLDLSHFPESIQKSFLDNDLEKGWVTMNGTHVFIGKDGKLEKGGSFLDKENNEESKNKGSIKDLYKEISKILSKEQFGQMYYLSVSDRDNIKQKSGFKHSLPRNIGGPTKGGNSMSILSEITGDEIYLDGGDLFRGDKKIMTIKEDTTWSEVTSKLKI